MHPKSFSLKAILEMFKVLIPFRILILSITAFSFSQSNSDFLILSQPGSYTILNQYQQPLSDAEKRLFVANVPLQIETENEILGDQITRALRFSFHGKTWFLQKDEEGNFLGDRGKQYRPVYKKCGVLGDTVMVTEDRAVSFSEKYLSAGQGFLGKGETVVRIFSYGGYCCVRRGGAKAGYGWSSFARKSAWKRVERAAEKPAVLTGSMSDRIVGGFAAANETYKKYFDHFNALTHQEKTVPAWRCEVTETTCAVRSIHRTMPPRSSTRARSTWCATWKTCLSANSTMLLPARAKFS